MVETVSLKSTGAAIVAWLKFPRAQFDFSSGTCEALKWIALVCMLIDHVNAIFYARSLGWAEPVGRIAMPVFTLLLGYNLARPRVDKRKMFVRLIVFGVLATPFSIALFWKTGPHWWPLNVLFTFLVGVVAVVLIQRRHVVSACSVILLGGLFVDYFWFGVVLLVSAWWFFAHRSWLAMTVLAVALSGLCYFNGNLYALLVIPLIYGLQRSAPSVPRWRWLFWAFYPVHLAVLWVVRQGIVS